MFFYEKTAFFQNKAKVRGCCNKAGIQIPAFVKDIPDLQLKE